MQIVYNIYRQVGTQLSFNEFFDYTFVEIGSGWYTIDLNLDNGNLLRDIKRL